MRCLQLFALILCLSVVPGFSFGQDPCQQKDDRPVGTFELKRGAETSVAGADFKLAFDNVTEDSRCPQGVTCVWAGNARLRLRLVANGAVKEFDLNTSLKPMEYQYGAYTITLVKLAPYPSIKAQIKQGDYVATLKITKPKN